jgi:uncharacterized membrane protein
VIFADAPVVLQGQWESIAATLFTNAVVAKRISVNYIRSMTVFLWLFSILNYVLVKHVTSTISTPAWQTILVGVSSTSNVVDV